MKVVDSSRKIFIYTEDCFTDFDKIDKLNKGRTSKKKKNKPYAGKITVDDYKIIVAKFIRIWLFNLLKSKGYYYFFVKGKLAKYKTKELFVIDRSNKSIQKQRVHKKINPTIGFFWTGVSNTRTITCSFLKNNNNNEYNRAIKDWLKLNDVNDLVTLNYRKQEVKKQ